MDSLNLAPARARPSTSTLQTATPSGCSPWPPDGLQVRREHAQGDLALRGAVSDLELLLYDRPPIGPVERFGEQAVLNAWYRAFHFG